MVFLGLPVPGSGHATYRFSGRYDAATGQLSGRSDVEVYYGLLRIYADTVDEYVLQRIQ